MTLTDREYQAMRDLGIAILREVGVDTGGCNIQFAIDPADGRLVVIEMNPRVSRSSALASKATGFPIAKIAAKLAIGYTLDEIVNDITKETPACLRADPGLRRGQGAAVRVREVPRRRPDADHHDEVGRRSDVVGPQLHRSARKVMRSLETDRAGFGRARTRPHPRRRPRGTQDAGRWPPLRHRTRVAARCHGREVAEASGVDPWFVEQIASLVALRAELLGAPVLDDQLLRRAKHSGLSDGQIAALRPELAGENGVRTLRQRLGIHPVYKTVDTCAAEFEAKTPYHYSTYELDPPPKPRSHPRPNGPRC